MKVHFLPVSWADISILEKDGHFALVDVGSVYCKERFDAFVKRNKPEYFDFILITHFHPDHYGLIDYILENFRVDTVYMKQFSGVVATDNNGAEATDEYRHDELENCRRICNLCKEKSNLVMVEGLSNVEFRGININLYRTENTVLEVFEDNEHPDFYHKHKCNENQNSMMLNFEYMGKNVVIGGDITDFEIGHPKIDMMNYGVAKIINRRADVYRAPHHGYGIGSEKALDIYKPQYVFVTNNGEHIRETMPDELMLKKANPDCEIYYASECCMVMEISENGEIAIVNIDADLYV